VPYVTGSAILDHVRKADPDADDIAWADSCAAAIEAAIADRLDTPDGALTPSATQIDRLEVAALQDGAACYVSRKAPHGVLAFGPDGDAVRLGRELLRECDPILYAIAPGIG
jgi:hypothetical protein